MKNKPPKKPCTFRLDADLYEKLIELAKDKDRTVSNLINSIVRQFLDKSEIETDSDKKKTADISLLFQVSHFNQVGYEKYVNELKTYAKEFNISNEDIFKTLTTILEYVWRPI